VSSHSFRKTKYISLGYYGCLDCSGYSLHPGNLGYTLPPALFNHWVRPCDKCDECSWSANNTSTTQFSLVPSIPHHSGTPRMTHGHSSMAKHGQKHSKMCWKNNKKYQLGALSKPGLIQHHPAVKDNWEWIKHNPPNAPWLLEAVCRLCALKITRNTLSGGIYHHTSSGSFQTNVEPLAAPKHSQNEVLDEGKHLVGVLKGQDRQDTQKLQKLWFYPQMMESPHLLLANSCENPRPHSENLVALNPMLSDVFLHHSKPAFSTFGATHCNTVYMCPKDLPTSKSMWINTFSCVPNSISPRIGPPYVLALTPMHSDVFPLDFEPNRAISTPGPYPTTQITNRHPLLLQQSHFDRKWLLWDPKVLWHWKWCNLCCQIVTTTTPLHLVLQVQPEPTQS